MKAIVATRYGSADVLKLGEIERPVAGPREVLIRVRAAGVDAGVWHLMTGTPYAIRLASGLRTPRRIVPGMDVAGIVETVGADVTGFRPGDAVFGSGIGTYAEYARAGVDKLCAMPKQLDFAHAATVPVSACTALQALRGRVEPGHRVLITGAGGGVGSYAVQVAKASGAEVTGVCSTSKLDLVRSLGADRVIDYTRSDVTDASIRYDVIIDAAGSRPVSRLRRILTHNGTLVLVGGEDNGRWLGMRRQLRAVATSPFLRQHLSMLLAVVTADDLRELCELIEAGSIRPALDKTYALADAPQAVREFAAGGVRGKIAVVVG